MVLIPHFRLHHYIKLPRREGNRKPRRHQVFHISDIHYGSVTFMEGPFKEMIEKIQKTPNSSVIFHGDLTENNLHDSAGSPSYDQYLTPDEQVRRLKKALKPISNKIRGIGQGNHDDRSTKKGAKTHIPDLCEGLKVPYLNEHSLHIFHIEDTDKEYSIHVTHGSTGATTLGGKVNAAEKMIFIYNADVYIYGHVHHLTAWPVERYESYGEKDTWFGINGSFMDYMYSYAMKKGYRKGIAGYLSTMIGVDGVEIVQHRVKGESWYQRFLKEFGETYSFTNKSIKTEFEYNAEKQKAG